MYFACCKYIIILSYLFCFNYIIVLFTFCVRDSLILAHAIGVLLYSCIALAAVLMHCIGLVQHNNNNKIKKNKNKKLTIPLSFHIIISEACRMPVSQTKTCFCCEAAAT